MAVKISQPKGGVAEPMATWSVISTPTSTGSSTADATSGANMGTSTRITTIGSTNMQLIKKAMQMAIRTPVGLASASPREAIIVCGIWANEMIQEKAAPAATRINTTAVIRPVDLAIVYSSAGLRARNTMNSRITA